MDTPRTVPAAAVPEAAAAHLSNTQMRAEYLALRDRLCPNCGNRLDVWSCCPRVTSQDARLGSAWNHPLYCGQPTDDSRNFAVDVPGVGRMPFRVHPDEIGPIVTSSTVNQIGREKQVGEVPAPLRAQLHEEAIIKLLFAARNLAESRLGADPWTPTRPTSHCHECKATAKVHETLKHRGDCNTARVFGAIEELATSYEFESKTKEKEVAPAEEGRAGDGIRSRGEYGEPWSWAVNQTLALTKIHDVDGCLVAHMHGSTRADAERASRLVDCVNTCAGLEVGEGVAL